MDDFSTPHILEQRNLIAVLETSAPHMLQQLSLDVGVIGQL
jgi:hypothetical protein